MGFLVFDDTVSVQANVSHSCPVSLQNKTCVQTLEGHAQNVSCVSFHPELPIIITGSEDGEEIP